MQKDIQGSGVLGRFSREAFLPMAIAGKELLVALSGGVPLKPVRDHVFIKMDENPFPELLDCRQPVGVARNRRAANGQLNILDLAIRACRSGFEPREAIKTR